MSGAVSAETFAAEPDHCGTCRFFRDRNWHTGNGTCRRYPVAVVVEPREWCGEFAAASAFIPETGES